MKRKKRICVGKPLREHAQVVSLVAFSNDGEHVVLGSGDCFLRIWKVKTGKGVVEPLRGHFGGASSVGFGSDGEHIVS